MEKKNSHLKTLLIICINFVILLSISVAFLGYFFNLKQVINLQDFFMKDNKTCTSAQCIKSGIFIFLNIIFNINYQFFIGILFKIKLAFLKFNILILYKNFL